MKALLLLLLIAPLHSQILGAFESFTAEDNATSWAFDDFSNNSVIAASWKLPNTNDAEIFAAFTEDFGLALFADNFSSQSFFVGDYTSAGIDVVSCEFFVEDADSFLEAEVSFLAGGVFYFSDPFGVEASGWAIINLSFSKDQWYIFDDTDNVFIPVELTDAILSDVTEIGVNFFPSSTDADGMLVALDNFTILPDLTPPTLTITKPNGEVSVSFQRIPGISYDLQMSSTLLPNDWSGLDDDTSDIRGEGLYLKSITARPKAFFRIATSPLFIEVP